MRRRVNVEVDSGYLRGMLTLREPHFFGGVLRNIENVNPSTSPNWIPVDVWHNVIHPEVLRQCDKLDGVCDLVSFVIFSKCSILA